MFFEPALYICMQDLIGWKEEHLFHHLGNKEAKLQNLHLKNWHFHELKYLKWKNPAWKLQIFDINTLIIIILYGLGCFTLATNILCCPYYWSNITISSFIILNSINISFFFFNESFVVGLDIWVVQWVQSYIKKGMFGCWNSACGFFLLCLVFLSMKVVDNESLVGEELSRKGTDLQKWVWVTRLSQGQMTWSVYLAHFSLYSIHLIFYVILFSFLKYT